MNVLITGAAGFIGSHFVDEILDSTLNPVVVFDKISYASSLENIKKLSAKINWYSENITNTPLLIKSIIDNNVDVIVNFAAETHVDNSIKDCKPFVESNVSGVLSILEACKFTKIKLLHISTDEVYGPANSVPFKESDKLSPLNPYSATKAASEHLIESYINTFKIDAKIIRPSNNFGPRQNSEKFIPKYIFSVKNNKSFSLYGDGLQIREWFYVKDCVKVIKELLFLWEQNKFPQKILNIGCPNSHSTNIDMCQKIYYKMKNNKNYIHTINFVEDRPGHDKKYAIDLSLLSSILPNFQYTNFETAIEETIQYYEKE